MAQIPRGFVLDDGSRNQKEREDRILAEAFPQYSEATRNDPAVREIMLDKVQQGSKKLPDSGELTYRRYRNDDTGEIRHIPEGDSRCWLPRVTGFKAHLTEITTINGRAYVKSTLQPVTKYQGIND